MDEEQRLSFCYNFRNAINSDLQSRVPEYSRRRLPSIADDLFHRNVSSYFLYLASLEKVENVLRRERMSRTECSRIL